MGAAQDRRPSPTARETRPPREARVMLAEIYGWFMEGFDTADLARSSLPFLYSAADQRGK